MNKSNRSILVIAASLILGLLLGWLIFGGNASNNEGEHLHSETEEGVWTCSMHPEIRFNEPGACPICGMDLIPLMDDAGLGGDIFTMTEDAMKLANIRTMRVGSESASKEMRLNGKVTLDERNTYSQSTHIPGRVERLNINFTGEEVRKGQTLAVIYSPELVTAQQELLQAYRIREQQPQLYQAVRDKLRNWRISDNLIDRIVTSGKPLQSFPISADVSGVVTEKFVELGDYVERGMPLYTVSDLSKVWVLFDIYESQMSFIQEGSEIEFTIASLPGESFTGKISFVDPLLSSVSRVATARVEISNQDGRLKPEMFASGVVKSNLGSTDSKEIIVPKSAVLWTGERSLVYVKQEAEGRAGFQLREVLLGASLGDTYVIEEGVAEGEEIVVNGTFTVDAAVQLSGRPSMMNPGNPDTEPEKVREGDLKAFLETNTESYSQGVSGNFKSQFEALLQSYLQLKESLVKGDQSQAAILISNFQKAEKALETTDLSGEAKEKWTLQQAAIAASAQVLESAESLEAKRDAFITLSEEMIKALLIFGTNNKTIFVDYCPMADSDEGAYWLSDIKQIRNPYFGDAMLGCGEIVMEIKPKP